MNESQLVPPRGSFPVSLFEKQLPAHSKTYSEGVIGELSEQAFINDHQPLIHDNNNSNKAIAGESKFNYNIVLLFRLIIIHFLLVEENSQRSNIAPSSTERIFQHPKLESERASKKFNNYIKMHEIDLNTNTYLNEDENFVREQMEKM